MSIVDGILKQYHENKKFVEKARDKYFLKYNREKHKIQFRRQLKFQNKQMKYENDLKRSREKARTLNNFYLINKKIESNKKKRRLRKEKEELKKLMRQ
jgi:hypothetical protein